MYFNCIFIILFLIVSCFFVFFFILEKKAAPTKNRTRDLLADSQALLNPSVNPSLVKLESIHSFIHYFLLRSWACKAATKFSHSCLSLAIFFNCPHVWFAILISASTDLRQVVFGLPFFLLPSGVQKSAVLVVDMSSFLNTWPIQRHF